MQARAGDFAGAEATQLDLFYNPPREVAGEGCLSSRNTAALNEIQKLEKPQAPQPAQPAGGERKEVERLIKEAVAQAEAGDMGAAQDTLAKASDIAKAIGQQSVCDWCLGEVAKAYAEVKDVGGANSTVEEIKDDERRSVAAYQVALILAHGRQFQEARSTAGSYIPYLVDTFGGRFRSRRSSKRLENALAEIDKIERTYGGEKPESPKRTNKQTPP